MTRRIDILLEKNRAAVADFVVAASAIPVDVWQTPIAAGKWSPAQHVDHVARAYAAAVSELVEGSSMRLIGSPAQRRWWRLLGLSAVRWLGRLPRGAPAPREIRPPERFDVDRSQLLAELDERVRAFEHAIQSNAAIEKRGFTHPYFGRLSARDGIRLLEVHTRHHERALRGVLAHSTGS